MDKLTLAKMNVISSQEESYKHILANLPPKQKLILQAIAKERIAKGVTSATFIKKYNLSSASSVQAALKPLLKNDLITNQDDAYQVYDYFFADWLAETY